MVSTDMPGITQGAKRAAAFLFVLTLALAAANLFFTTSEVGKLRNATLAACAFAADLGSVPVPAVPRPSKLGISLVADSRQQWRELGCPGHLAPPQPSFTHWARYYGLPEN